MNILDIIGPVMVGPSSSHTAGAVRIGLVAGKLLAEPIKEAQIHLHGSFWATGSGHGGKVRAAGMGKRARGAPRERALRPVGRGGGAPQGPAGRPRLSRFLG